MNRTLENRWSVSGDGLLLVLGLAVPLDIDLSKSILGLPRISIAETTILLCFFLWILSSRGRLKSAIISKSLPFFVYSAWILLVSVFLGSAESLKIFRDVLVALCASLVVSHICRTSQNLNSLTTGFLCGVLVNCVLGASQFWLDWPRPTSIEAHGAVFKENFLGEQGSSNVVSGVFGHPNLLAFFLAVGLALCLSRIILDGVSKKSKIGMSLLALTLSITLYFTYGKGAILWLAVGLIALVLATIRRKYLLAISIALLTGTLSLIILYVAPSVIAGGGGGTIATRLFLWDASWNAISSSWSNLLIGGSESLVMRNSIDYSNFQYENAHNSFINQAVYFGLPGATLYAALVLSVISNLSRASQSASAEFLGFWSSFIVMIGIMIFEPFHTGVAVLSTLGLWAGVSYSVLASESLSSWQTNGTRFKGNSEGSMGI